MLCNIFANLKETFVSSDQTVDPSLVWTLSYRGLHYKDWDTNPGSNWFSEQSDAVSYLPDSKAFFYLYLL